MALGTIWKHKQSLCRFALILYESKHLFFIDGASVVTLIGSECSANMLKLLTGIVAEMNVCRVVVAYALAINIAMHSLLGWTL